MELEAPIKLVLVVFEVRVLKKNYFQLDNTTDFRMIAIPFAGGSSTSYREFKGHLPPWLHLFCLELPGRGKRVNEPLLNTIDELSEDLFQTYKDTLAMGGPYVVYGHSMGAVLGYELCKKILVAGLPAPRHLFVSGHRAPAYKLEDDIRIHLLPRAEFFDKIIELGGTPEGVLEHESLQTFFEPYIRADFRAIETYEYQHTQPLPLPITVFYGSQENLNHEEVFLWQRETTVPVRIECFFGGHFFIYDHLPALTEIISNSFLKVSRHPN